MWNCGGFRGSAKWNRVRLDAGLLEDGESFQQAFALFCYVAFGFGEIFKVRRGSVGFTFIDEDKVDVRSFCAALDVLFVIGAGGLGMVGAEPSVRKVEVFGCFKKAEIFFHGCQ